MAEGEIAQSPLFHARHADRYARQELISDYGDAYDCRLIVMIDAIFGHSITPFEELIYDADPGQDLHLMLYSPGGDGETAVRLVRAAQARCRELTVMVPDQAKSAATLLALGAHHILLGPTSDLGPVDPQFMLPDGSLASAKDIIAAVDDATAKVQKAPDTYRSTHPCWPISPRSRSNKRGPPWHAPTISSRRPSRATRTVPSLKCALSRRSFRVR